MRLLSRVRNAPANQARRNDPPVTNVEASGVDATRRAAGDGPTTPRAASARISGRRLRQLGGRAVHAIALRSAQNPPTWQGSWTVAALGLRRTTRSTGWRITLAAFTLGLYGIVLLTWLATRGSGGGIAYGLAVSLTLAIGLICVPTLAGRLISADRETGALDLLRATRLRSIDHALGLLLHIGIAAAVFAALAVPMLVLAVIAGGVDLLSFVLAPLVLWWTLTAVGAVALAVSAQAWRARHGVAIALLSTTALVAGTAFAYAVFVPATEGARDRQVAINAPAGAPADQPCTTVTRSVATPRTEWVWWLLAPNPVVVVADAAPAARSGAGNFDPLGAVSASVRSARDGVGDAVIQECWGAGQDIARPDASSGAPVWPSGLAALTALGALATAFVERKLRAPAPTSQSRVAHVVRRFATRLRRPRESD